MPDWNSRTNAAQLWIEQGLGKPSTFAREAASTCGCHEMREQWEGLSLEELSAYSIATSIKSLEKVGLTPSDRPFYDEFDAYRRGL